MSLGVIDILTDDLIGKLVLFVLDWTEFSGEFFLFFLFVSKVFDCVG